jgi:hypothetical protein
MLAAANQNREVRNASKRWSAFELFTKDRLTKELLHPELPCFADRAKHISQFGAKDRSFDLRWLAWLLVGGSSAIDLPCCWLFSLLENLDPRYNRTHVPHQTCPELVAAWEKNLRSLRRIRRWG